MMRFTLVLSVLLLALGSDCCPPREKSDEIYTEQRAENLVQEVNDPFLKRITRYFFLGGVLQAIHEKYPDGTLYRALKNFIGKTEDMNRCWNDWWSIGGKVDAFQSSNLTILAEINFNGRLQEANKARVATLVDNYERIINAYDRMRSGTRFDFREEHWTITNVLNAQTISSKIQDGTMLFQEGKNGYQSVNDGTFVTTWNRNA